MTYEVILEDPHPLDWMNDRLEKIYDKKFKWLIRHSIADRREGPSIWRSRRIFELNKENHIKYLLKFDQDE